VQELSSFLRGWAGYFRYGNSARSFDKISPFATGRWRGVLDDVCLGTDLAAPNRCVTCP
jgi:Group II intron, maturase-specific domain